MAKKIKWTGPIGNPGAPILGGKPDPTWQAKYKARLDELAREAAIRRERLQKIVDDATLDKLVKSFPVPQEKRSAFYSLVRCAIRELWRGMAMKRSSVRRALILKALDQYQAAVDKVRELLTPDYAALLRDDYPRTAGLPFPYGTDDDNVIVDDATRAVEYARSFVLASLCGEDDEDDNVIIDDAAMTFTCNGKDKGSDEVMTDGVALLDNLDLAIEKAKPGVEKAYKDRGRPHGAQGDAAIDLFLSSLISYIRKMGGHIATSRTQASSPTYIGKAVDILRPFLPGNFPVIESLERKFETIGTKKARPLRTAMPTRKTVKKRDV